MKQITRVQDLVGILEGGQLAADLSSEIADVIDTLRDHAEGNNREYKGSVTIKLDFAVKNVTAEVTADIVKKLPKISRQSSHYFVGEDGALLTEHPHQRSVFDSDQPLRAVDD